MTTTEMRPTKPGQMVRSNEGSIGITTGDPAKRTPTIGVMFVGGPYPIRMPLDELTVMVGIE